MNSTNRGLNRFFILVIGLLVIAAGGLAVVLGVDPTVSTQWKRVASTLQRDPAQWVANPLIGQASALVIGIVVVALILIVLLIAFIAKQGHGHTAAALQARDGDTATQIDLAVPRSLLEEHLRSRDELAALRISAYEVQGTPMLKISATCRRGTAPDSVAQLIGGAVQDLERIIGTEVPALIQLTGGFRAGRSITSGVN